MDMKTKAYRFKITGFVVFVLFCLALPASRAFPLTNLEPPERLRIQSIDDSASGASCDYFVDDQGSNGATGTNQESAWKTLQHATDSALSGAVICIMSGTYKERVDVKKEGQTFYGLTRHAALVDGGFEVNSSASNVQIEALRITKSGSVYPAAINIDADGVKIYDNYFDQVKAARSVEGNWRNNGANPANVHIKGNFFYKVQAGIWVLGKNWLIENNEVDELYNWNGKDCDYTRFHGDGHIFRENNFHGATAAATGDAHVDCFQTWDHGSQGYHIYDVLIEKNVCFNFGQFAMISADNNRIARITVRDNLGVNFDPGYRQGNFGLNIEDADDVLIENNTLGGFRWQGALFKNIGNMPTGIVKNNIFFDIDGDAYRCSSCSAGHNIVWQSDTPTPNPETNLNLDPQFVNPVMGGDFHLQPESPGCSGGEGGKHIGAYSCN